MAKRWKKYLLYASAVIVGGSFMFVLIETFRLKNTGFETKTLWDWMELLIIPLFLAGGAFFLNRSERKTEREITTDRQQEAAFQSYLDRMGDLLLKEKLRTTRNKEVRNVARIRTLTVLRGLDATRKGIVVKFLYEAGLILIGKTVVDLSGADLEGANLRFASLDLANLSYADLSHADLRYAQLEVAKLRATILRFANLQDANLRNATLDFANLQGANLKDAITAGRLAKARSLKGATMPDGTIHE